MGKEMIFAMALALFVSRALGDFKILNFNNAPTDPSYILVSLNLSLGSKKQRLPCLDDATIDFFSIDLPQLCDRN
jgi:hypothetical protein